MYCGGTFAIHFYENFDNFFLKPLLHAISDFRSITSWRYEELIKKIHLCCHNKTVYHSTSSEQTCMHTILMVKYGNGR